MSKKYMSEDNRTGYPEGEIVELSLEELYKVPFRIKMKCVEPIDEKALLEKAEADKVKEELKVELSDKGLSNKRVEAVCAKFHTLAELKKNASKAGIDGLTDEWIKKEYGSSKSKKKKEGD